MIQGTNGKKGFGRKTGGPRQKTTANTKKRIKEGEWKKGKERMTGSPKNKDVEEGGSNIYHTVFNATAYGV